MLFLLDKSAHERAAVDLQETMLTAGMHRKPIPDLIIASVAKHHDAVLVHHDRDFEDMGAVVTDLRTRWITPPSSSKGS